MSDNTSGPRKPKFWQLIVMGAIIWMAAAFFVANVGGPHPLPTDYATFMTRVESGDVTDVSIDQNSSSIIAATKNGLVYGVRYAGDENIAETIRSHAPNKDTLRIGVQARGGLADSLIHLWPILLVGAVVIWLFKSARGGQTGAARDFGGSKATLVKPDGTVMFADVILDEEVKDSVTDLVQYIRDPARFQRLGAKLPKGALFMGPPGCGKTMLARALAGEAGVPFFSISGSDFVEMFVGVGASRVRALFAEAGKNAPCILFIDEIDAVGRHRGAGVGGGHDEREQTLNQLLVELDGMQERKRVFVIAATNRPDVLDPALLRRFETKVVVPRPDVIAREAILRVHSKKLVLATDIHFPSFAKLTSGHSGDDLKNFLNQAAIIAGKANAEAISDEHLQTAFDRAVVGARSHRAMTQEDKRWIAYHEAGHTLIRLRKQGKMRLHKVTIIPRGNGLGFTWSLPEGDRLGATYDELCDEIQALMGGRAAELLEFGVSSTGAANDIEVATHNANDIVRKYGMDPEIGPVCYAPNQQAVFLGRDLGSRKETSAETERAIEVRVRKILVDQAEKAYAYLKEQKVKLDALAGALLVREQLTYDEIMALPEFSTAK